MEVGRVKGTKNRRMATIGWSGEGDLSCLINCCSSNNVVGALPQTAARGGKWSWRWSLEGWVSMSSVTVERGLDAVWTV